MRTPPQSFYLSLDSLLGNKEPVDAVGSAKEKLLDRIHLADTVFRLFGGADVYSPKPRCMPEGGWLRVVRGLART